MKTPAKASRVDDALDVAADIAHGAFVGLAALVNLLMMLGIGFFLLAFVVAVL